MAFDVRLRTLASGSSARQSLPLELFATKGIRPASSLESAPKAPSRPCDWAELDGLLPDGGLPHAVVEIVAAPATEQELWTGATAVATAAVRAAQGRDARAWCAWIDAKGTLYAPGLLRAGVDLARLLVVRPPPELLARVAVKVASSGAFDVLVAEIDRAEAARAKRTAALVRKLALAAEQHGTTIVLLSSPHASPWPVALRLEVARTMAGLSLRITKERHGRLALAKTSIPIAPPITRSA
ncbi:MAG TPA: recombinase A [Polyangiaceae bacterium]|nr:recombinase A [Polyangiaceae bacterium]